MSMNVVKTCLELIEQRGYDLAEQGDTTITAIKPDGELFIVIFGYKKFGIEALCDCVSSLGNDVSHVLVPYEIKVTSKANEMVEHLKKTPVNINGQVYGPICIELFNIEDLKYNITKHKYQPIYERLPDKDAKSFLKKWDKYGTFMLTDPIVKFYNYNKGDVIKIIRQNKLIYFRIVR